MGQQNRLVRANLGTRILALKKVAVEDLIAQLNAERSSLGKLLPSRQDAQLQHDPPDTKENKGFKMTNSNDHNVKIIEFRWGHILYHQNQSRTLHVSQKNKNKIENPHTTFSKL